MITSISLLGQEDGGNEQAPRLKVVSELPKLATVELATVVPPYVTL